MTEQSEPPSVFEPEWLKQVRRAAEDGAQWVELDNDAAVLAHGDLTDDEKQTLAEYIDWRREQRRRS